MLNLPIKILDTRLTDPEFEPRYTGMLSAAFDVRAALETPAEVPPGGSLWIGFGFQAALPEVLGASVVAKRLELRAADLIDGEYLGEWGANFLNLGGEPVVVAPLEVVASIVLLPRIQAELVPVDSLAGA